MDGWLTWSNLMDDTVDCSWMVLGQRLQLAGRARMETCSAAASILVGHMHGCPCFPRMGAQSLLLCPGCEDGSPLT